MTKRFRTWFLPTSASPPLIVETVPIGPECIGPAWLRL
jgi:hypothetical protein